MKTDNIRRLALQLRLSPPRETIQTARDAWSIAGPLSQDPTEEVNTAIDLVLLNEFDPFSFQAWVRNGRIAE